MDSSQAYSSKAENCLREARKTLKGSFFGNIVSNKQDRAQQALQLFKQAATNYKLAKRWDQAAQAYLQCVQCDRISKSGQAAEYYQQAASMKERINSAECIKLLQQSIAIYIAKNKISNVAKTQKRIAEIYQKDTQFTLAMKNYRQAAQNFSLQQNQSSSFTACMLKVVDIGIYAAHMDYAQLIKTLENVAEKYMQNKLTAPSAKDLYFKAVLLFLANDDSIGAEQAMQRYINADPTFYQTRQQKFCAGLIKATKEQNLTLFSEECYKFNEIIPLDKWKTHVLTVIKATIPGQPGQAPPQSNDKPPEEEEL